MRACTAASAGARAAVDLFVCLFFRLQNVLFAHVVQSGAPLRVDDASSDPRSANKQTNKSAVCKQTTNQIGGLQTNKQTNPVVCKQTNKQRNPRPVGTRARLRTLARKHTRQRAQPRTFRGTHRYSLLMQRQYNGARSLLALPIVGRGDVHPPVRKHTHTYTHTRTHTPGPVGSLPRQRDNKPAKTQNNTTGRNGRATANRRESAAK